MTPPKKSELYKTLALTAEAMGYPITAPAALLMASDLAGYPEADIAKALARVRREHAGRLTVAAVVQRIEDGHLGVEAAWALCPSDEGATVVWTQEIAEAFGVARPLLEQGDAVAARMAFKETYAELLRVARADGRPAAWTVSLGHDATGRAPAINDAVKLGRLAPSYAVAMLPPPEPAVPLGKLLARASAQPEAGADEATTEAGLRSVREALTAAAQARLAPPPVLPVADPATTAAGLESVRRAMGRTKP